ncbi:hypothetical protein VHEMI01497 [[Torrubiella] hemipterigena]|uniref:DUF7924 domain-containing protein n=1 Tax=[Torrubiella] hemipterigena TaxID=1531966 RepID=A0A0A1ST75_9HYPO|nr:hypothetical protein VHEMI01497 [[Torrubiella] hemipterigena]
MRPSTLGISEGSHNLVASLLNDQQPVPQNTLFDDDCIARTCANLSNRNEAKVIQDISRLLVPSAEAAAFKHESLGILTETVSARWTFSQPLTQTQPAPDYAVGFRHDAFTRQQSTRMRPFIGNIFVGDESLFLATAYLRVPFLTCEVKGAGGDLQVADRQNAHSATLAVRAIAELFLNIGRADEVNREILAFSISHNDSSVQIYGHYPVIADGDISYFRHPIHAGFFKNKTHRWTSYRFTMNVYTYWVPMHWGRLCSAIDQLAEVPSEDDSSSAAESEAL